MAGLDPAIHGAACSGGWIPGSSPGMTLERGIDRKLLAEFGHAGADLVIDRTVFFAFGQRIENVADQMADLLEFLRTEAAAGQSGRAETDARGDGRLFRV